MFERQENRVNLRLERASDRGLDWSQQQWTSHHYLHAPIDSRCSVLAYVVKLDGLAVGALGFGRPESTRCYQGGLTYGSLDDVKDGRARYSRWEVVNLARVWLDPRIQRGGAWYAPNAATWAIGEALRHIVVDYLVRFPPCFLDEPWKLRSCLSYCDRRLHQGTIYRAAGFVLVRTNDDGIETWARSLRGLQGHERQQIEKISDQHPRSRRYRAQRAAQATQEQLL